MRSTLIEAAAAEKAPTWLNARYAEVAASLLPVVEQIEPKHFDDYFWRSLMLHRTNERNFSTLLPGAQGDAALAILIARYDHEIARALVPTLSEAREAMTVDPRQQQSYNLPQIIAAQAALDPAGTVAMLESLPNNQDNNTVSGLDRARSTIANFLMLDNVKDRWDYTLKNWLNLWVPGQEDL